MSRFAWISFVVVTAVLLLLPGGAFAAETKKLEDHNFEWTLAPGWQFMEISSDEESGGWVARAAAGSRDTYVVATVRSTTTEDPNFLAELTSETREFFRGRMGSTSVAKVTEGSLAGVDGTLVILEGKNSRDVPVLMRIYGIQNGKRIHQLAIEFVNGSQGTLAATTDQTRRGFKLLSGGGEEGEDDDLLGLEGEGGGGGGDDSDPSDGDSPSDSESPTQTFTAHNVKWTLPEGSPFAWRVANTGEDVKEGLLAIFTASVERPALEGKEDDGPRRNTAEVALFVRPLEQGFEPALIVKNPSNQMAWEKANFDQIQYARTKVVEELPIGNVTGAGIQMVGMKDESVRVLRLYFASVKATWYRFEIVFRGDRDADDDFKNALRELMKGVEFLDTFEWVRGPVGVPEVPPHNQERGTDHGREKGIASLGFQATKPPEMHKLKLDPAASGGNLRLAWEMRSEDKESYLYFSVRSWSVASLRQQKDPEEYFITTREGQWREAADSPNTIKKGKTPFFRASWGGGKGLGYEFTGYLGEAPFVERGFVVQYKKHFFWIQFQLGGKDAEKTFKKTLKTLKKSVKFSR